MRNPKDFKGALFSFLLGIFCSGLFLLAIPTSRNKSEFFTQPPQESLTSENYSSSQLFQENVDNEKININTASVIELMNLPGIGEAKANSIVEFRARYGAFEEIDELSYVSGIGDKLLESLREMVTIGHE